MPRYINIHPIQAMVHCGEANLPVGMSFGVDLDGFIYMDYKGNHCQICLEKSERAYTDFAYDQDGHGEERKDLIDSIKESMARTSNRGEQFEVFFNDPVCMKYKKHPNNMDEWSWDRAKVHKAPIEDLKYIQSLTRRFIKFC